MYNSTSGSICSEVAPVQEESLLEADKMDEADKWVYWEKHLQESFEVDEHAGQLRDIERSRKFYLRRRDLTDELEDVFVERSSEDYEESEGEEILQVVWFEGGEDENATRTSDSSPTAARKKSNSKFTLSVCSDMTSSLPDDDSSGDDLSDGESVVVGGRFLEAKDSIEVMATSSKSLRSGHNKSSDWDEPTLEEVSCVWYSEDQANEDANPPGAQALEAREAEECLVLAGVESRRSGLERTKRVSFYESCHSNDSVHSEEMFSLCRQLDETGERPLSEGTGTRISDSVGEASSKSTTSNCSSHGKSRTRKRVSFHDLPKDNTSKEEIEGIQKSEEGGEEKLKADVKSKHVSFHKLYLEREERPLDAPCLECFNSERDGSCSRCGAVIHRVMPAKTPSLPDRDITDIRSTASMSLATNEVRRATTTDSSEETIRSILARGPRASSSSPFLASSDCDSHAGSDLSTLDLTTSFPGRKVSSVADVKQTSNDPSNVNFLESSHHVLSHDDDSTGEDTEDKSACAATVQKEEETLKECPLELKRDISLGEATEISPEDLVPTGADVATNSEAVAQNELLNPSGSEKFAEDCTTSGNIDKGNVVLIDNSVFKQDTIDDEVCVPYAGNVTQSGYVHIAEMTSPFNPVAEEDSILSLEKRENNIQEICQLDCLQSIDDELCCRVFNNTHNTSSQENLSLEYVSSHVSEITESIDSLHELSGRNHLYASTEIIVATCQNKGANTNELDEYKESIVETNDNISTQNLLDEDISANDINCTPSINNSIVQENRTIISEVVQISSKTELQDSAEDVKENPNIACDVKINEVEESCNESPANFPQKELQFSESLESEMADDVGIYNCEIPTYITEKSQESETACQSSVEEPRLTNQESSQFSFDKNCSLQSGVFVEKGINRPEDVAMGSGDDWPNLSSLKDNCEAPLECPAGDLCLKGSNCEVHCIQALHYSAEEYESADSDSSGFVTP